MKKVLLLLFSIGVISSCQDKDDFSPYEGIEYRDDVNRRQTQKDPSDWTLDNTWSNEEKKLFADLEIDLNGLPQGGIQEISFYPNPVNPAYGVANFDYRKTAASNFSGRCVIVDGNYKVLFNTEIPPKSFGLQLPIFGGDKFEKGKIYRMYYVFYEGSILYYKGHGDIKIAD
ncbi:hypothetical protein H8B13_05990 [Hymenobacter sp. BT188]|uniref:hypothetical protein n=1 Tax=Hymenobacter sp. BT188 TaxID=2763504 RepID=UPI0016518C3A|nr:hypothetical protein [Hymenobacter sp. BT188]MBC6606359.1 hypothetical protein [Hymenobacter sp. BT188]